ncbi:DUF4062 domain-containing protein [Vibrio sp. TRT 21S02]|uniref:DUF4062 domain-containing protein n=1 Tax=Vibrio sp. TRT 21S02 TaxID=3418507 RepID=UPI003CE73F1D
MSIEDSEGRDLAKPQVFVSSTYKDLKEERKVVTQTLLEIGCIPVGMEMFPASNDSQWTFIKRIIDESDFYLLILGDRYGSLGSEGLSYTEMEYRYAIQKKKPVVSFLRQDLEALDSSKKESCQKKRNKLESFREMIKGKLCKHWNSSDELSKAVMQSTYRLMSTFPDIGWVRSNLSNNKACREKSLFVSTPLTTLSETEYEDLRISVIGIIDRLRNLELVSDVYYINEGYSSQDSFTAPELKPRDYLSRIENSDYFVAIINKRVFSSVHFEAGYALAKGKRLLIFVRDFDDVTFVNELCAADYGELVTIRRFKNYRDIEIFLVKELEHLLAQCAQTA